MTRSFCKKFNEEGKALEYEKREITKKQLKKVVENGDKLLWISNDDDDDDNGDDEPDKIPTHHLGLCLLGFCPLGFILHTWQNSD